MGYGALGWRSCLRHSWAKQRIDLVDLLDQRRPALACLFAVRRHFYRYGLVAVLPTDRRRFKQVDVQTVVGGREDVLGSEPSIRVPCPSQQKL